MPDVKPPARAKEGDAADAAAARRTRLSAALRANLRRRKTQTRERATGGDKCENSNEK